MNIDLGLATMPAITAICFLIGIGCKNAPYLPDESIPTIMGAVGLILGIAALYIMPGFPAEDPITAAAIGAVSGLAATGLHQTWRQAEKMAEKE